MRKATTQIKRYANQTRDRVLPPPSAEDVGEARWQKVGDIAAAPKII